MGSCTNTSRDVALFGFLPFSFLLHSVFLFFIFLQKKVEANKQRTEDASEEIFVFSSR